jgi:SRP54-type protein, GTPase domain
VSTPGELLGALGREARARLGNGRDASTRTYRGRSVDELVPRIQRELGADAIIVRRRDGLTGGVLGFFQHAFVEIEAMPGSPGVDLYDEADSAPPPVPGAPAPALPAAPIVPAPGAPAMPAPGGQFIPDHRPSLEPPGISGAPPAAGAAPQPAFPPPAVAPPGAPPPPARPLGGYVLDPRPAPTPTSALGLTPAPAPAPFYTRTPVEPAPGAGSAYVTAHLAALARADRSRIARREPPGSRAPGGRARDPQAWSSEFQELVAREEPELFAPIVERAPPPAPERRSVAPGSGTRARAGVAKGLRRYGIGEQLAGELIDGASAHALALAPRSGLAQAVRATLAQRIPVAPVLPTTGAAIVVVGPGGAGKTTLCAALLGAYRKSSSLPASCATLTREDERAELRMVLSPHVMKPSPARAPRALRALRRARGDGVAVLDTPSVSPSERAGIRELAGLLGELAPERVVVALPATLGAIAAAQLLEALAPLGANALAITHADETDQIGVAVEAACRFGLAPEYMLERGRGGGWRLQPVDPTGLAEKLLQ